MAIPMPKVGDSVIAILGAPASGGSTLCKKAMNDPRLSPMHYVSVDDLLRGMLSGDEVVPTLKAHMICLPYVSAESRSKPKIVLLDGFPQSLEEAEAARRELRSPLSIEFPDLAIYFSCPKNVLKNRYVAKGEGLYDGSLFEKRFKQHEMECPAVVERYREIGSLVEIDSSGSIDESYEEFIHTLKEYTLAGITSDQVHSLTQV